jgi:drug/metabolite transporter (DMT)-like permease
MPVLLALASALVYGVGDWFGGRASRHQPSVVVAATGQIVSLVLVGGATLVVGTQVPAASTWWWSAFGGVVGALGIAGLYHGFAHGDISVVAPTSAVVGASVPVVVAIGIGERPSASALVGIVIAVGAVALVSGALGTHQHNTPPRIVALAVAVGACFGLLFVALERTDSSSGLWPLVIARFVSIPMLILLAVATGARPQHHRSSLQIAVLAG